MTDAELIKKIADLIESKSWRVYREQKPEMIIKMVREHDTHIPTLMKHVNAARDDERAKVKAECIAAVKKLQKGKYLSKTGLYLGAFELAIKTIEDL